MAVVKKIPESENGPGVKVTTRSKDIYHVSQRLAPLQFTLWKEVPGGFEKVATAKSPLDLYEIIPT